jgi:sulfur dioxygenase
MLFRQLNQDIPCRTYLVADERSRLAMLVDPVLDHVGDYMLVLQSLKLQLKYVVDTHLHADHRSGAASLKKKTGATYLRHTAADGACIDERVTDGSRIELGEIKAKVLHMPGHSEDSIALAFSDRLLTGDFLLLGDSGAGRTDVGTGDAEAQWESLQRLAAFDDATLIYPGHAYRGQDVSTLGEERKTNPRLLAQSKEEYVRALRAMDTGPSTWMQAIARDNQGCVSDTDTVLVPNPSPTCETGGSVGDEHRFSADIVRPEALAAELANSGQLLLLEVGSKGRRQTPGAIPLDSVLAWALANHRLHDRAIVTVCDTGVKSARAAAILKESGFSNVRSLEGGMARWHGLGLQPMIANESRG